MKTIFRWFKTGWFYGWTRTFVELKSAGRKSGSVGLFNSAEGNIAGGLSVEQRRILGLDKDKHVVFAPPGTGKTELLARRLQRVIQEGIHDPSDMVCLTFTNRAARNMEERVGALAERVFVGNFHSYASRYLRETGRLGFKNGVINEHEAEDLMREAVDDAIRLLKRPVPVMGRVDDSVKVAANELNKELGVRGNPGGYALNVNRKSESTIRAFVSSVLEVFGQYANMMRLKCPEHICKSYAVLLHRRVRDGKGHRLTAVDKRLAVIIVQQAAVRYRKLKDEYRIMDFNDLLAECLAHMVHTPIKNRPVRYGWIQVDEAQDLNPCQWEMLRHMHKPGGHLVVFADREQAIYSFMGASSKALNTAILGAFVHRLKINYRSPGYLLTLYRQYARATLEREITCKPACAREKALPADLCLLEHAAEEEEYHYIAQRVVPKILQEGNKNTAVLMRTNKGVEDISSALLNAGHDHFVVSTNDVFQYAVTRDFMAFLETVGRPEQRLPWARVWKLFGGEPTLRKARKLNAEVFRAGVLPHWLLGGKGGNINQLPSVRLASLFRKGRLVVIDTETTGKNVLEDDIIQFAAVELVDGRWAREMNLFLKTERDLGDSQKIHSITNAWLNEHGEERRKGLEKIREFIGDVPLVAHNVMFDAWMLEQNLVRANGVGGCRERELFCTLEIARALDPEASSHCLECLIERYSLPGNNSHDARDDVYATVALIHHLACKAESMMETMQQLFKKHEGVFAKMHKQFGPLWNECRSRWLQAMTMPELFDRFRDAVMAMQNSRVAVYKPEWVYQFRKKWLRHAETVYGRCPVIELTGPVLQAYRLCRETDLILEDDRLIVSTVHRAKGLEFDSVIIPGAHDKAYPFALAKTDEEKAEEARCFYVALTRAKKQLVVSYARRDRYMNYTKCTPFLQNIRSLFSFYSVLAGDHLLHSQSIMQTEIK